MPDRRTRLIQRSRVAKEARLSREFADDAWISHDHGPDHRFNHTCARCRWWQRTNLPEETR